MTQTSLRELQSAAEAGYDRVQDALDIAGEKPVQFPRPPANEADLLEVYKSSGLACHANDQQFRIRCWQAQNLGFPPVSLEQLAMQLMGECANGPTESVVRTDEGQRQIEYYYDLATDKEFRPCRQGGAKKMTTSRIRRVRQTDEYLLWMFPYRQTHVVWEVLHRPMDDLATPIPYGVMLRVGELKRAKLFSCFSVLAPAALFGSVDSPATDPVLVGTVARSPIEGCVPSDDGVRHFFVARWEPRKGGGETVKRG